MKVWGGSACEFFMFTTYHLNIHNEFATSSYSQQMTTNVSKIITLLCRKGWGPSDARKWLCYLWMIPALHQKHEHYPERNIGWCKMYYRDNVTKGEFKSTILADLIKLTLLHNICLFVCLMLDLQLTAHRCSNHNVMSLLCKLVCNSFSCIRTAYSHPSSGLHKTDCPLQAWETSRSMEAACWA